MVSWGASVWCQRPLVGCFCTVALLHELRKEFGPDLECDESNLLEGLSQERVRRAAERGIRPDSPVVECAARNEVQFGPRYAFRLRVGPNTYVEGMLDRYFIRIDCERETDFPEPMRGRFVSFLESLQLGGISVEKNED